MGMAFMFSYIIMLQCVYFQKMYEIHRITEQNAMFLLVRIMMTIATYRCVLVEYIVFSK